MNDTQISVPSANIQEINMTVYLIEKSIDEKTVFNNLIDQPDRELCFEESFDEPEEKQKIFQKKIFLDGATSSINEKNLSAQKSSRHSKSNRKDNTHHITKLNYVDVTPIFYELGFEFLLNNIPTAERELSWQTYLSNTQEKQSNDAGPKSSNSVTETNKQQNKNDQSSEDGVTQSANSLDGVKIQKAQSSQTESDSTNNQSSSLELLRKENDRLHEKIRQLVEENQVLQRENSKTGRKTRTKEKQNAITNHENNAKKPVFICKSCGLKFSHRSSLSRHINTHKPNKGYNFKCRLCEKVFRSPSNRSSHEKLHAKEPKRAEENSNHVESTTVE